MKNFFKFTLEKILITSILSIFLPTIYYIFVETGFVPALVIFLLSLLAMKEPVILGLILLNLAAVLFINYILVCLAVKFIQNKIIIYLTLILIVFMAFFNIFSIGTLTEMLSGKGEWYNIISLIWGIYN